MVSEAGVLASINTRTGKIGEVQYHPSIPTVTVCVHLCFVLESRGQGEVLCGPDR